MKKNVSIIARLIRRKPQVRNHAQLQKPDIKRISDYEQYCKDYEEHQKTGRYFADPRD